MYSTVKTISIFSVILVSLNIIGAIMTTLFLMSEHLNFSQFFSIMTYLVTTTVVSVLLTAALRCLLQDLEIAANNENLRFKRMNERITELESRLK